MPDHYLIPVETTRTANEWIAVPVGQPGPWWGFLAGFFALALVAGLYCGSAYLLLRVIWLFQGDNIPQDARSDTQSGD